MALPQKKIAQVGIQSIVIFPYAGAGSTGTYPYDTTTIETVQALQFADLDFNITLAEYFGGESPDPQGGEEVKRETNVKFAAVKFTLRALQVVMGGNLVVNSASVNGGEVQVLAKDFVTRAPYFRCVTQSIVGTGIVQVTYPKCKVQGSVSYHQKMDAYHIPEFPFKAFFDDQYLRLDGGVGATSEVYYGDGRQIGLHS